MNTYTKILSLKKKGIPPGEGESPVSQVPKESEQPIIRSSDQPSNRTVARTDQPINRSDDRPEQVRKTERASYEFYADQIEAIRRLRAQRELTGKKVSLSDIVREALDAYLKDRKDA